MNPQYFTGFDSFSTSTTHGTVEMSKFSHKVEWHKSPNSMDISLDGRAMHDTDANIPSYNLRKFFDPLIINSDPRSALTIKNDEEANMRRRLKNAIEFYKNSYRWPTNQENP